MRIGQEVTYVEDDHAFAANVVAIVGSGPSLFKMLDLTVEGTTRYSVPNIRDRVGGVGYWTTDQRLDPPRTQKASKRATPAKPLKDVKEGRASTPPVENTEE